MKMSLISKKSLVLAIATTALAGCATSSPTTKDDAFVNQLIAEKVAVAADAQREYVALVNEDKASLLRKQTSFENDEVDVDYIGKPQELLQTFAHRYGYRYIESGKRRELRTINVRVRDTPPVEVLRNIGYQVDYGANVELDKNAKTLRLIYKNLPTNKGL